MALVIHLIGIPRLTRDGIEIPSPRGHKTWALLVYLRLADRPPSRTRLTGLLFPEAADPLGALRWSLWELRRVLGPACSLSGDPVLLELPPTAVVDVDLVRTGRWQDAVDLPGLTRLLLEGLDISASAEFEMWLATARRRLAGAAEAVLHEAAVSTLASGSATEAVGHAFRLVEIDPLNDANHVLLVQCLRAAGEHQAAVEHVTRCRKLFVRELGVEPGQALREAANAPFVEPSPATQPSILAMLEAGELAVETGAVTQGLHTLRQAAVLGRRSDDRRLLARVLVSLGHALVHVGMGGDEEGAAILHEGASQALECGEDRLAGAAYRELAYADLQRGRYQHVLERTAIASRLASGDDSELAWIESIAGAALSDQGLHDLAFESLRSAVKRAQASHARQAGVFAHSFLGRLHLLRGELEEAGLELREAAEEARTSWIGFAPFPESLLAEVERLIGELDGAERRLERAFVMGRQFDDACLESIAARGLGLLTVARGRTTQGYHLLVDAPRLSRRLPDSYLWIEAYALDALCTVAIEHNPAAAPRWVADLEALASRCGMQELIVRAMLHRSRLGDRAAFDAASELAGAIDNPALHAELSAIGV